MKKVLLGVAVIGICLISTNAYAIPGIDNYTTLMLHFDGVDGGTSFTDSSFRHHEVAGYGEAELDTTEKMFGSSALDLDGNSYLSVLDSDDWFFGGNDFTIDMFSNARIFTYDAFYIGQYEDGENRWGFGFEGGQAQNIYFYSATNGLPTFLVYGSGDGGGHGMSVDTWNHVALARNGNVTSLYVNGIRKGYTIGDYFISNLNAPLEIGISGWDVMYNGWIDELRVSTGVARWTSNFTPPTSAYEPITAPIPEPTTISLLGLGLLGLAFRKKKTS